MENAEIEIHICQKCHEKFVFQENRLNLLVLANETFVLNKFIVYLQNAIFKKFHSWEYLVFDYFYIINLWYNLFNFYNRILYIIEY